MKIQYNQSFKMRMSDELQEKLKKENFNGNKSRFDRFNRLFNETHRSLEDSTVLHLREKTILSPISYI